MASPSVGEGPAWDAPLPPGRVGGCRGGDPGSRSPAVGEGAGWGPWGEGPARRRRRPPWQSSRPGSARWRPLPPEVTARAGPSRRPALCRRHRSRPSPPPPPRTLCARERGAASAPAPPPPPPPQRPRPPFGIRNFPAPAPLGDSAAAGRGRPGGGARLLRAPGPPRPRHGPGSATAGRRKVRGGGAAASCAARGEVSARGSAGRPGAGWGGGGANLSRVGAGGSLPPGSGRRPGAPARSVRLRGSGEAGPQVSLGLGLGCGALPAGCTIPRFGCSPKCRRVGGGRRLGGSFVSGRGRRPASLGKRSICPPVPLCLSNPGLAGRTCAAAGSPVGGGEPHSSPGAGRPAPGRLEARRRGPWAGQFMSRRNCQGSRELPSPGEECGLGATSADGGRPWSGRVCGARPGEAADLLLPGWGEGCPQIRVLGAAPQGDLAHGGRCSERGGARLRGSPEVAGSLIVGGCQRPAGAGLGPALHVRCPCAVRPAPGLVLSTASHSPSPSLWKFHKVRVGGGVFFFFFFLFFLSLML